MRARTRSSQPEFWWSGGLMKHWRYLLDTLTVWKRGTVSQARRLQASKLTLAVGDGGRCGWLRPLQTSASHTQQSTHTHVNVSPNGNTMWKDYVLFGFKLFEFGFFWNSFRFFCFFTIKTEEFEGKEHHFPLHLAINSFKLETWAEKIFLYS